MKPQPDSPPGENAVSPVRDAPAFDFYPERWLVGVAGMSDAEQLTYLRLLCHQWLLQGLPADLPALKRLGGGKGVTPAVLAKLPLQADGKRRNARLETIREEQRERIAKSREKIAHMNAARAAGRAATKGGKAPPRNPRAGTLHDPLQDARPEHLQEGRGDALGEVRQDSPGEPLAGAHGGGLQERLGERLDGFLTPHHPPPTSHLVPEDANNAGAREADAAGDPAAAAVAKAEAAAAQAAADAAADQAAAAEAAAERAAAARAAANAATPSLDTVLAWAASIGCPPDKAEIWWHEHEARPLTFHGRWTDRDGNALQRPQHALAAWWQKWQANDHQRNTRHHPPSTTSYHAIQRPAAVRSDSANAPGRYA